MPPHRAQASRSRATQAAVRNGAHEGDTLHEGARIRVEDDRFERSPEARRRCIAHYGAACFICGFDFAKNYGEKLAGFIHVHHIVPLASTGQDHIVDSVRDLRPLCPNCHYFVHSEEPPINVDDARKRVAQSTRRN